MKQAVGCVRPRIQRMIHELESLNSLIFMNPGEVSECSFGYPKEQRKVLRGTWIANGVVSDEMLSKLGNAAAGEVVHELSGVLITSEGSYAVIATQLGTWQHRLLMPLYAGKALDLFTGIAKRSLSLSFTTRDLVGGSMFYRNVFSGEDCVALGSECSGLNADVVEEFAFDLPSALWRLMHPAALPSLEDTIVVRTVEVSVLVPPCETVESACDECVGAVL